MLFLRNKYLSICYTKCWASLVLCCYIRLQAQMEQSRSNLKEIFRLPGLEYFIKIICSLSTGQLQVIQMVLVEVSTGGTQLPSEGLLGCHCHHPVRMEINLHLRIMVNNNFILNFPHGHRVVLIWQRYFLTIYLENMIEVGKELAGNLKS